MKQLIHDFSRSLLGREPGRFVRHRRREKRDMFRILGYRLLSFARPGSFIGGRSGRSTDGSRTELGLHVDCVHRRRDEPPDAAALGFGDDRARLHGDAPTLPGTTRAQGGAVLGSAQCVPDQQPQAAQAAPPIELTDTSVSLTDVELGTLTAAVGYSVAHFPSERRPNSCGKDSRPIPS